MKPDDIAKAQAQLNEIVERPDFREIIGTAFAIARRVFRGPADAFLIGLSDDTPGCLLWRAAQRGDVDAMVVHTKMPKLRIRVATSEERVAIARDDVVRIEVKR
jgi:hypothetical protein